LLPHLGGSTLPERHDLFRFPRGVLALALFCDLPSADAMAAHKEESPMKRLILLFACLALSMAACSDESPVAVSNLDGGDPALIPVAPKSVPFHVAWVTSADLPPAIECSVAVPGWDSVGIFGEGDATHMGPTILDSVIFGEAVPPGFPGGQTGCAVITADNGDELHQVYDGGTATFDLATFTITGSGTWHWDGGTGRFANATGSGTYEFFFNALTEQGLLTVDGRIAR